ncbi:hypothetical protein IMZ48_33985, partial [Candidatus Bathyarchaeota archaeon]|nr:hypothetical protein [Candidatus Bathyarchaeota archaeon]
MSNPPSPSHPASHPTLPNLTRHTSSSPAPVSLGLKNQAVSKTSVNDSTGEHALPRFATKSPIAVLSAPHLASQIPPPPSWPDFPGLATSFRGVVELSPVRQCDDAPGLNASSSNVAGPWSQ